MTRFVIDASVAVKWFVPEIHSDAALRLRGGSHDFIAPDSLPIELANTLLKKAKRSEFNREQIAPALTASAQLFSFEPSAVILGQSVDLAFHYSRSVYDALYVALAIQERCPLVTADRKLYDAISPTLPDTMLWVEDIP